MSVEQAGDAFVAVRVGGIVIDPDTEIPVVILRVVDEPRLYLPIFIGGLEATAIATVVAGVTLPRPMTHDLLASLALTLGASIARVTVTHIHEGTFHAELTVVAADAQVHVVDARPSDAIAIALRVGAPLFVARSVVAEAGALGDPEVLGDALGSEDALAVAADEAGRADDPASESGADLGRGPALLDDEDVRLEDLAPEDFGKYKM